MPGCTQINNRLADWCPISACMMYTAIFVDGIHAPRPRHHPAGKGAALNAISNHWFDLFRQRGQNHCYHLTVFPVTLSPFAQPHGSGGGVHSCVFPTMVICAFNFCTSSPRTLRRKCDWVLWCLDHDLDHDHDPIHVQQTEHDRAGREPHPGGAAIIRSHLDLICAPYVLYGVKYIDPVPLALFQVPHPLVWIVRRLHPPPLYPLFRRLTHIFCFMR